MSPPPPTPTGRRRLERAGTEIVLTPREYGLLEYLIRHRGDIVTKTEILEGVWDPAFEGDPNLLGKRQGENVASDVRADNHRLDVALVDRGQRSSGVAKPALGGVGRGEGVLEVGDMGLNAVDRYF